MALKDFEQIPQEGHESEEVHSNIAKEYLEGLAYTVQNWSTLSEQDKKDRLSYYGYTLGVIVGAPAAATFAFLNRI